MKPLKAVIVAYLLAGIVSSAWAQKEPVIFLRLEFPAALAKNKGKAKESLSTCGFSFAYDSATRHLSLYIHDPRMIPKFINSKSDRVELRLGDEIVTLSGKAVREQLVQNYTQTKLPALEKAFQEVFVKYAPGLQAAELKGKDLKTLYVHSLNVLSEGNLDSHKEKAIKSALAQKYRLAKKQYGELNRVLSDRRSDERIVGRNDGSWALLFPDIGLEDFSISFFDKKHKLAELQFDTLYGAPAAFLPDYETAPCEPFNRYTYFKRIKGAGLHRYKFPLYQPTENLVGYRQFIIRFDKNSSDCSFDDVKEIVKLLNDSSYTIRKAKIFAFASVEGDEQSNLKLHQERARILLDLLQSYNRDTIELVEFHTGENWEKFHMQIKGTKYESYTDSSEAQVKNWLSHPSVAAQWEDSLAVQRKAVLQLQLFQKANPDIQLAHAIKMYGALIKQYVSFRMRQKKRNDEALIPYQNRILSVDDYLKQMVRAGKLPVGTFDSLQYYGDQSLNVIRFYSMMLDDIRQRSCVYKNREAIIASAYYAVVDELYDEYRRPRQKYLQSQAIDIQLFAFEQIDAEEISPEVICEFAWPDKTVFYPLILNELDYVNKQGREFVRSLSCYRADSTGDEESISAPAATNNPHAISFAPPLDYRIPHTSYYFYLKKRILENDRNIRQLAVRSDDYLEFDLYDFLAHNILHWDVWNNRYYDDAVDYRKMIELMNGLVKMNHILCPRQLFQLYLDLHLRVSYLVKHNGGYQLRKEALNSLRKLQQYCLNHIHSINEKDALTLVNHMVWMGKYFHANETLEMARELKEKLEQNGLSLPFVTTCHSPNIPLN